MGVFRRWITSKKGKTPYWYIRYTVNKKQKWESIGKAGEVTKSVAQAQLAERKKQIRLGTYGIMTTTIPTFEEFSKTYLEYIEYVKKNRSLRSTILSVKNFSKTFKNIKLSEISTELIEQYKKNRLGQGLKPSSVNRELAVIKNLFNYAIKNNKFFGKNPISEAGLLEVNNVIERILTQEEEIRLLDTCDGYLKDIVLIALNTGMRQGEIFNLRWDWIDFKNEFISLPQTHTKSKKERKVPINQTVKNILMKRKLTSGGMEFVFISTTGISKNINTVKRSFKKACNKAGIDNLRFHDLRHTCATRLVEFGIPLHTVAKLLGHSSIRTTERYSHPENTLRDAVDILANNT